jgi:hypothetical protein
MQLGEEDEGYLRWLRVAQPGDRPHYVLTLENVMLNPERVSRSTWKFLVCTGRQMTEMVWLTAAQAWNMPVSRMSADAATRLGLTERPNDWCQVRPCNAAGRQEDGFLAKIASVLENARAGDCSTGVSNNEETTRAELPEAGCGDRHQGLGSRGEVSLQRGTRQERRAERDSQAPHLHSAARWRKVVSEFAGERDGAAVQDHLDGDLAGPRGRA